MTKRQAAVASVLIVFAAAALAQEPAVPTYELEEHGMHAGLITRDREAILAFDPVGVWAVPEDDTVNSPTMGYMYVYPDGTMTLLRATDCRALVNAEWEREHVAFRIIDADGSETDAILIGVPGRIFLRDGQLEYGFGQRVFFGSNRYWIFMSPDVDSEC